MEKKLIFTGEVGDRVLCLREQFGPGPDDHTVYAVNGDRHFQADMGMEFPLTEQQELETAAANRFLAEASRATGILPNDILHILQQNGSFSY